MQSTLFDNKPPVRIEHRGTALAIYTPYDQRFLDAFKAAVSPTFRKWEPTERVWLVSPSQGDIVARLMERHFAFAVDLPTGSVANAEPETTILDVRYIGATKFREDGSETAYGFVGDGWNAIFPKSVLTAWFGHEERPGEAKTLYGVLGVKSDAEDSAIKKAYRRMALQWHPDQCSEPDAREQFEQIQRAYQTLREPRTRARYDAGLALERSYQNVDKEARRIAEALELHFRPPLRCGLILVNGQRVLGRFAVDAILEWTDIVDRNGRVLVTSWPAGADKFTEQWVYP